MAFRVVQIGDKETLTALEQVFCEAVAESRRLNNRSSGVPDKKMGGQSGQETDLCGVGAEFAFCKLFNLFPDLSIEPRSAAVGTDAEKDSNLFGWLIDIKGTNLVNGRLLSRPMDAKYETHAARTSTNLFALMTGPYPTFTFRGFFSKEDLLQPRRVGNLGHGPTYIAAQHELYNAYLQCPDCEKLSPLTAFSLTYVSQAEEKFHNKSLELVER